MHSVVVGLLSFPTLRGHFYASTSESSPCILLAQNLPNEIADVERRERAVALQEIVLNDTDGSLQSARQAAERWDTCVHNASEAPEPNCT